METKMNGIKPFEQCVKSPELRAIWLEVAEAVNLRYAIAYMRGEPMNFVFVDGAWGNPTFWLMVDEVQRIAKHFDYNVEAGYSERYKTYDFEILSPEELDTLAEEATADC
jgi:hypothetical protein